MFFNKYWYVFGLSGCMLIIIYYFINEFRLVDQNVTFSRRSINIDSAKLDQLYKLSFTIYNHEESELIIKNIIATCSCVIPEIRKATIRPYDSLLVFLVYKPKIVGYDKQIVTIKHNRTDEYQFNRTIEKEMIVVTASVHP